MWGKPPTRVRRARRRAVRETERGTVSEFRRSDVHGDEDAGGKERAEPESNGRQIRERMLMCPRQVSAGRLRSAKRIRPSAAESSRPASDAHRRATPHRKKAVRLAG